MSSVEYDHRSIILVFLEIISLSVCGGFLDMFYSLLQFLIVTFLNVCAFACECVLSLGITMFVYMTNNIQHLRGSLMHTEKCSIFWHCSVTTL